MGVDENLKKYIEEYIFPKYEKYFSHGLLHISNVLKNMMMLADYYELNKNMAYTIASFHDIGLNISRENHEIESGKILKKDEELKKYFTSEQIEIMKTAIEDHRGSKKTRPRNFYGECISDADRDFDIHILAKRQLATSIKNYPDLTTFDTHFERCYEYLSRRINASGNFNLWTNNEVLVNRRDDFEKIFFKKEQTRSAYKTAWDKMSADGTLEKILTFYEDF